VRRDIEMTRDRISTTLSQLEQKTNVMQIVRDHPWPALAVAVGTGVLLSGSGSDMKAAAATASATRGASSKIGNVLDDVVANLMTGVSAALQDRVESLVTELKEAIGAPTGGDRNRGSRGLGLASTSSGGSASSGSSVNASSGESSGAWAPQSASDDRLQGLSRDVAGSTSPNLGSTVGTSAGSPGTSGGYQVGRSD